MNNLISKAVTEKKGQPVTTSRKIAKIFGKEHKDVLETIRNTITVLNETDDLTANFSAANFKEGFYKSRGKQYPEYILNKEGFILVTMGYNGKKAMAFKVRYINQFNQMQEFIETLHTARLEFPAFTNAILNAHEEPQRYHFTNEINMINRIVLGMSASEFKKANGIDKKVKSIRPYLGNEQIKSIEALQRIDIGLIVAIKDYEARKQILIDYFNNNMIVRLTA